MYFVHWSCLPLYSFPPPELTVGRPTIQEVINTKSAQAIIQAMIVSWLEFCDSLVFKWSPSPPPAQLAE